MGFKRETRASCAPSPPFTLNPSTGQTSPQIFVKLTCSNIMQSLISHHHHFDMVTSQSQSQKPKPGIFLGGALNQCPSAPGRTCLGFLSSAPSHTCQIEIEETVLQGTCLQMTTSPCQTLAMHLDTSKPNTYLTKGKYKCYL